jgi:CO/xanthine dehydrogenase Mo-binding subunit
MIATAPAVLNAISRAIGRRIRRLPATPERVFRAMRGASE